MVSLAELRRSNGDLSDALETVIEYYEIGDGIRARECFEDVARLSEWMIDEFREFAETFLPGDENTSQIRQLVDVWVEYSEILTDANARLLNLLC